MRNARIMVIDDSELVLDVVGSMLREAGYDVVTRSVAVGASAQIVREQPDIVLLDVAMPLVSGAEISEAIRKNAVGRRICILLHSDRPEPELAELVARCGANGYIRKGTDPARFVNEVRGWIERSRGGSSSSSRYGFVACAPSTRAMLERELLSPITLRYSDSSAEALRHVCSPRPPSLLLIGTSRVDLSCGAIYRAACRNHPTWKDRIALIEEPASPPADGLEDVPRWSTHRPLTELSALLGRLAVS